MFGRMNILSAVRLYLSGMVDQAGAGMKVLLMDRDTISFVSVAFAQSDMHSKEVYLFERINKQRSDGNFDQMHSDYFNNGSYIE